MTAQPVDFAEKSQATWATISDTVDSLRRLQHLSVKDLASSTGIDEDTLGRRIRIEGKRGWQAAEVAAVASALGVEIELLYRGLPDLPFLRGPIGVPAPSPSNATKRKGRRSSGDIHRHRASRAVRRPNAQPRARRLVSADAA